MRWRKHLNAPTAGQYMKLSTTKSCPRITVWRTVKSAGNRWARGTARTFGTTNSSRCQTARMFERGPALTSTIGVGSYHLDRIRMKLPRTSVQGFERPGRSLYGLRRASRITDINSLLQALEWVSVRAEQSLEEANAMRLNIDMGQKRSKCHAAIKLTALQTSNRARPPTLRSSTAS